jgi:hypothetical protein
MQSRQLRSIALAAASGAILAHGAFAAGEPKNEPPFTRPVAARSLAQASRAPIASPQIRGEAKNERPFTDKPGQGSAAGNLNYHARAEAKDEKQFTTDSSQRPATVIVPSKTGFSLTDGAIGAVAGIGIALSGGAALALARKSPRTV